ncbi:MAG TPA: hypothetical protein VF843_09475 [Streptosporangiaceae bacterium]
MYFVLLAAALAILAGVVAVAMGRGGELTEFAPDRLATPVRLASAADVAALRLPLGLIGYQQQAADEALRAVMIVLAEREAEIARLRAGLGSLSQPWPEPAPAAGEPGPAPAEPAASPSPPA